MQVSKVQVLGSHPSFKADKKEKPEYENPISRKTERNLAILSSVGSSSIIGVVAGFLATNFSKLEEGEKRTFKNSKMPIGVGVAVAAVSLAFTLWAKLYNTKVGAFKREKDMDYFSREMELKSNLTGDVNTEVKDPEVSLDKKLDDNLKLQMANKGQALGLANITPSA